MNTNPVFDIDLIGVGGQGIGLLSEVIIRAVDHAGFDVVGVDTHGLAQRQAGLLRHPVAASFGQAEAGTGGDARSDRGCGRKDERDRP